MRSGVPAERYEGGADLTAPIAEEHSCATMAG